MKFLTMSKTASRWVKAIGATALTVALAGCSMANIASSSGQGGSNVTAHADISGTAHGGYLPISFASVDLYAVDNTAYGGGPDLLTSTTSGTTEYYPGVNTAGCDNTALTAAAYAIVGGTATITAPNTMIAGQLITISDSSGSGLSGTYLVATPTSASFSVATNLGAGAGTTSGTFTPVCYTVPTTDVNGAFNITGDFNCGTHGASVAYVQLTGGNPGITNTTNNTSIALTALLQSGAASTTALTCSQLSSANFVVVNELTTAAMGVAMGQFFTTSYGGAPSTDGFGSGSSTEAQAGITNAANTALKLVSTATGLTSAPYTLTSGSYSITVTPEATKLQTIADILASCVQGTTANANCSSMFGALRPTGAASAPTDTLQAAALFGTNPTAGGATNNLALWNLVAASGAPFTAVAAQPADWTIGIQYVDTSCTAGVGTTSAGTCALNDPQEVLTDQSGNIFVMNHQGATENSVTKLLPSGSPVTNLDSLAGVNFNVNQTRNMAIDLNGSAWLTMSTSSQVLEYVPGGTNHGINPTAQPYAITIDGNDDVFVGFGSTSSVNTVNEFVPLTANSTTPNASDQVEYPLMCSVTQNAYALCSTYSSPSQTNAALPQYGALDTNGNIWFDSGSAASTDFGSVIIFSGYNGPTACTAFPCLNTTTNDTTLAQTYTVLAGGASPAPTFAEPFGIAAGPGGTVWLANTSTTLTGKNTIAEMTSTTAGMNYGSATTLNQPEYVAVDGAGNVWVTNLAGGSVSEFQGTGASVGTALSPAKTGTAPYTGVGFVHSGMASPFGISIDFSGNVWVANNTATTGGIFELVGAGAPTDNPISQSLHDGKVGAKP